MKKILSTTVLALILIVSSAQVSPTWNTDVNGSLIFQKVTATGNHIVSTSTGLYAYDPANGNELWAAKEFSGITESQVEEVNGSPLLLIRHQNEINIVDPFNGRVLFNSAAAGFSELKFEQMLFRTNGILVAGTKEGKTAMQLIDLASGKMRWEINEQFGRLITAREFSETELLVVALMNVYRIKSTDGSIVWKESTSAESAAMQDAGALGALFQAVAEDMAADIDFVLRYYESPDKSKFIIASEVKNEIAPIGNNTEPSIVFENNYTAFNQKDGKRLWNQSVKMKGKLGDLAFYKDGVIILPDDGNNTLINFFSFSSPEGQWGKKGNGTKIKGGVYNHITTDKGLLLISGSGSNTFLTFLDPATGELTFDKPVKVSGEVAKTFDSPLGLGFVTTGEFDILNTATGELVIDKSIPTSPNLVQQRGDELFIFDTKANTVSAVNLKDGSVKAITTEKLKFDGKETPTALELRDNGILLTSEQNIALYDFSGNLVFNKYFSAPTESGLKKALLVAQAVRAVYIGANAYAASGALQAAAPKVAEEDAIGGALVQGIGSMYQELGNAASDFAKESLKRATARFKATTSSRDYLIVLGEVDKNNALLKVNKNTGEVDAQIDLGKEKEPKYAVDDVTGKIFKVEGGSKIECYDL